MNEQFIITPVYVVKDKRLSANDCLIFGLINGMTGAKGYFYGSNEYLMEFFDLSEKTIKTSLKRLEDCGYIQRVTKKVKSGSQRKIFISHQLKKGETFETESEEEETVTEETNEQKIIQDLQALNIPTTSHTVEVVEDWLSMYEVELIKAVIDKCVSTAKNGVNLNYLKRAMQSLTAKGIKTVEDLERAESLRSKGTNKQRTETMPDYSNQSTETENMTEAERQATLQEIEELMKDLI